MTFVAGTLIHTKEGLKPIEQIKVGDWVLSKPEDGTGETTYKRVTETFEFEDKEIVSVTISLIDMKSDNDLWSVITTANHLFWVSGEGWTRADNLVCKEFLLNNGEIALVHNVSAVLKTNTQDVGWIKDPWNMDPWLISRSGQKVYGRFIDLRNNQVQTNYDKSEERNDYLFELNADGVFNDVHDESSKMRTKVYNFTVEDYHTYFVTEKCVLVYSVV